MKLLTTADDSEGRLDDQLAASHLDVAQVVSHLKAGALVLSARGTVPDRYDPAAPPIPIAYLTDGLWVWSWATACYVERYRTSLPTEFLSDVAMEAPIAGYPNEVSESALQEALAVVKSQDR